MVMGKGDRDMDMGVAPGGGVDGELLPPELLPLSPPPMRGKGEADDTGLLETEESLDTFADANRRLGRSSINSSEP